MNAQTSLVDKQTATCHDSFKHLRTEFIPTLNIHVHEYTHLGTGAIHYHLSTDNDENVFLVALRTVPTDSTGVAHMLEHTVLCGSQRYPVRDPFFMMIRRSLNTFMNAFTSSDWTAFPFASKNKKDFNNLLDVYLDAVFFSNLNEQDFAQEGHRLEFDKSDDPTSPLLYKGVVFNEMKGAMGSEVSVLWQTLTRYLFPTNTYHFNSGGEPQDIPDLSYGELVAFYRKHYHPSNSVFMTYGNIPAEEHQKTFHDLALSKFEKSDHVISVPNEKRYLAPVNIEEYYAVNEEEEATNKTHVVLGWLLGESTNINDQFTAHLLSGALMDNSASPLLQAMETSDLGSAPSPLCGIDDSNKEINFMCGLEGAKSESAEAIENRILEVLNDVATNGIPTEQMEAVLHQFELAQREIGGGGYPYGLQIILDALPSVIHRNDPVKIMNIDSVLIDLREKIKNPEYIKNLVRELLLDNPHRVRITLKPDPKLDHKRGVAEKLKLEKIAKALSDEEKKIIVEQAAKLKARQQQEDDIDILPTVTLNDIPDTMYIASGDETEAANSKASCYTQPTNGISYFQTVTELPALTDELLNVLPIYTSCLTELGFADNDYLTAQKLQASATGGIHSFTSVRGKSSDIQDVSGYFFMSGKSLARDVDKLTQLTHDILTSARFDEHERIRELITQQRLSQEQGVTRNGHGLAMAAACSGMSGTANMKHRLNGLFGIQQIKKLDNELNKDKHIQLVADKLSQIHQLIAKAPRQFVLIGEEKTFPGFQSKVHDIWRNTSTEAQENFSLQPVRQNIKQMWITGTPVNFCAKAYPVVSIEHEDAPILSVLGGFLRNGYLHTAIRENGGAYGSGAGYQADIAAFRFHSYRDPRLVGTLQDFDQALQWLQSDKHEWRQVEEAILGVISTIDKPTSPAGEAKDAFQNALFGRTPEQRQDYRRSILKVTLNDLQRVGQTYFQPDKASIAVITNIENAKTAKELELEEHHL